MPLFMAKTTPRHPRLFFVVIPPGERLALSAATDLHRSCRKGSGLAGRDLLLSTFDCQLPHPPRSSGHGITATLYFTSLRPYLLTSLLPFTLAGSRRRSVPAG